MGNEGDKLDRFIELSEECRVDGIAEFLAQACEVEADKVDDEEDEPIAKAWAAMAPELRTLARRAAALYAAARRRKEEAALDEDARAVGPFIGMTTTYLGTELPALTGQRVRVVALLRDGFVIKRNSELAAYGGVAPFDRIEVHPFIGGRASYVSHDPRAIDLECFASLRAPKAK
jgi:hypothetical protein